MIAFFIGLALGGIVMFAVVNRETVGDIMGDNSWSYLEGTIPEDLLIKLKKDQKIQFMNNKTHVILTIEGDA